MGGFFGVAKRTRCVNELFYGVDYNSHMGTKVPELQHVIREFLPDQFIISKIHIFAQSLKKI